MAVVQLAADSQVEVKPVPASPSVVTQHTFTAVLHMAVPHVMEPPSDPPLLLPLDPPLLLPLVPPPLDVDPPLELPELPELLELPELPGDDGESD